MTEKVLTKLGDICREVKLSTKKALNSGYDKYIGLEHLDSNSLKIKRWGSIEEDSPSFTRVFKKGHILFGKRRPYLRKAAIAEFDGICSGDIIVIEAKDEIIASLLPHIIQSNKVWEWAIKTSSGSLSPRTKFKSLAELKLDIPNKSSQKILDIFAQNSHEFYSNKDISEESFRYSIDNILRCILRYGFDRTTQYQELKSLGVIPKGWNFSHLDDVAKENKKSIRTGPFGSSLKAEHWRDNGRAVVTIGCLGEYGYEDAEELYIDEEYAKQLNQYSLKKGDIAFSRVADIGRAIICNEETEGHIISSNLMKISLNQDIVDPYFIYFSIKHSPIVQHQIKKYTNAGGRLLVTSKDLRKIKFPLPPIKEQLKLSSFIRNILELQQTAVQSKTYAENTIAEYLSKELTGN